MRSQWRRQTSSHRFLILSHRVTGLMNLVGSSDHIWKWWQKREYASLWSSPGSTWNVTHIRSHGLQNQPINFCSSLRISGFQSHRECWTWGRYLVRAASIKADQLTGGTDHSPSLFHRSYSSTHLVNRKRRMTTAGAQQLYLNWDQHRRLLSNALSSSS